MKERVRHFWCWPSINSHFVWRLGKRMTNREIVIALVSSIVSGFVVWLIQQTYLNRRERRRENEQRTIKARNSERVVGDDIFHHLGPGNTIDLMKDMFGVANKYRRGDSPVF